MHAKKIIITAALNSIALTIHAQNKADVVISQEVEKCFGIQKKEMNSCAVDKTDIDAANAAFKNKYKKSTTFECAGNVMGSDKKGYLGWLYVAKGSCLKIEGGFLIKKDEKGKKVVEKG
ncbi:hypothetical protein ACWNT8_12710 [Pigmentibacter ruber]|uniref:hypothetical protein n=1 Tax=Pigmentibacter ruber TaxID=2683196 RepID=UPI00131B34B7|nr:hypothetical protein [Pigmentibacter ruber]